MTLSLFLFPRTHTSMSPSSFLAHSRFSFTLFSASFTSFSLSLFLSIPPRVIVANVQRMHFILFHFVADPTTHLISSGQRWLADTKLREYVTGPENPTEAAHSLFLSTWHSSPSLPRALLIIVAVISVAESFHGFDGRELRDKLSIGGESSLVFSKKMMVRVPIVKWQRGETIDLNDAYLRRNSGMLM